MTDKDAVQQAVEFGGFIVAKADQDLLPPSTVFNGLAMAASACLVDYVADMDGNVDPMSLLYAANDFKTGLDKALEFAVSQLKAVIEARNANS